MGVRDAKTRDPRGGGGARWTIFSFFRAPRWTGLKPFFPRSHGVPRVGDRRVVSGIVYVIRNVAAEGRPPRLWPAEDAVQPECPLEPHGDATHFKAHRTAANRHKKGIFPAASDEPKVA